MDAKEKQELIAIAGFACAGAILLRSAVYAMQSLNTALENFGGGIAGYNAPFRPFASTLAGNVELVSVLFLLVAAVAFWQGNANAPKKAQMSLFFLITANLLRIAAQISYFRYFTSYSIGWLYIGADVLAIILWSTLFVYFGKESTRIQFSGPSKV